MIKTLKVVVTDYDFEELKSGQKTHLFFKDTPYWRKRLVLKVIEFNIGSIFYFKPYSYVKVRKAGKNPERMTFRIGFSGVVESHNGNLFDIELEERIR